MSRTPIYQTKTSIPVLFSKHIHDVLLFIVVSYAIRFMFIHVTMKLSFLMNIHVLNINRKMSYFSIDFYVYSMQWSTNATLEWHSTLLNAEWN
jgi:hypothetical protein